MDDGHGSKVLLFQLFQEMNECKERERGKNSPKRGTERERESSEKSLERAAARLAGIQQFIPFLPIHAPITFLEPVSYFSVKKKREFLRNKFKFPFLPSFPQDLFPLIHSALSFLLSMAAIFPFTWFTTIFLESECISSVFIIRHSFVNTVEWLNQYSAVVKLYHQHLKWVVSRFLSFLPFVSGNDHFKPCNPLVPCFNFVFVTLYQDLQSDVSVLATVHLSLAKMEPVGRNLGDTVMQVFKKSSPPTTHSKLNGRTDVFRQKKRDTCSAKVTSPLIPSLEVSNAAPSVKCVIFILNLVTYQRPNLSTDRDLTSSILE